MYHYLLNFFIYGFLGWCTEVAFAAFKEHHFVNRGFLNGPICPIYGFGVSTVILFLTPFQDNLLLLYLVSTIVVTALEWLTGFLLEKLFHSRWWDYSNMPLNLNGYVCLLFSLIWGVACIFIVKVFHPLIAAGIHFLPHTLGWILIAVFGIMILIDTYVTASGIFKMNKRLERMEQIAEELHSISDRLGENIYKNVMETLEFKDDYKKHFDELVQQLQERREYFSEDLRERREELSEDIRERREEFTEDIKEHMKELLEHYQDLRNHSNKLHKRIVKAFPHMHSSRYSNALKDLQDYLRSLHK